MYVCMYVYGKWFPWELTDGQHAQEGKLPLGMNRSAWCRFIGSSVFTLKNVFHFTM